MLSTSKTARYFGDTYRLNLQDRRVRQERNQRKQAQLAAYFCWILVARSLQTTWRYKPEERILDHGSSQDFFQGGRKPRLFLQGQPNFLGGEAGKCDCKFTLKPINITF
jgi:hypothetical protein